MKKSRILKLSTLIGLNACPDQVKLFRKTFGESVRVTERLCLSVIHEFNWCWAGEYLLSVSAHDKFWRVEMKGSAECYMRPSARAWVKYQRAIALAFARGYLS
jgi:hypothetical protein